MIRIIFSLIMAAFLAAPVTAQQESVDLLDYSYGEVLSAGDPKVSVLEYDYDQDREQAVDYALTPQTTLTGFSKPADLVKGDMIEIYFKTVNGAKIADTVIKDDTGNPVDDQTPAP